MPTTKLQNPFDFEGQKFYIGIDVHKKSWSVSVRSLNLQLEHFSQPPSVKILINHLQKKNIIRLMKPDLAERAFMNSFAQQVYSILSPTRQISQVQINRIRISPTFATAGPLPSIWKKAICTGSISCPEAARNCDLYFAFDRQR